MSRVHFIQMKTGDDFPAVSVVSCFPSQQFGTGSGLQLVHKVKEGFL